MDTIAFLLDRAITFARAGGGGSSSGDLHSLIVILPGIVSGGAASFVKRKTQSKLAAFFVGAAAGLAVSLLYLLGGIFWFSLAVISAMVGAPIGAFADKLGKFRENSAAATAAVQRAAATDPMWNQQYIIDYARQVFNRFQYDWGNSDTESIRQYTTQRYANHVGLMLYAMNQMGRKNLMTDLQISEIILTDAHDSADNQADRVSVGILAQANDRLIETATGKQLMVDNSEFGEQWNFVRDGNIWRLDSIDQETEESTMIIQSLKQFAAVNHMYFSPDWGKLLLPTRGELFKHGFVGTDINNHIIGFWTGDLLVQLYTYKFIVDNNQTNYLVGQVNVPKSYGGILIERNDEGIFSKRLKAPSGYKKVTLEWGDFNKRYRVYATDENQVTSFELLNPSFMAWLYDNNLKVNIEVVDNIIYLYAKISLGEQQRYAEMMEILQRSHKELKM